MKIELSERQYQDLVCTLEGCRDEIIELMYTHDYYVSQLPENIEVCLDFLGVET